MNLTIPQGWQCPMCNKIYSPTTPMCFTCPQKTKAQSHTGENPFNKERHGIK